MGLAPDSKKTNHQAALLFVAALALGLRVWNLNLPFLEPYNNIARQSIVASVARNFYERGFNFFYPEIDENGKGPYLYNAEMPFYSYGMALGYKLVGGAKPYAARAVSVAFSLGTLFFVYQLCRRLYDDQTALAALTFTALTPLNVALSRSIQPEETMLCASVGALYAFYRYLENGKTRYYLLSMFWMFLAIATKFLNAYLFIPIVFWAYRCKGLRIFVDPRNYLYVLVSCLSVFWYVAMWKAGQTQNLGYGPYRYLVPGVTPQPTEIERFPFWPYVVNVSKVFLLHILTPLGIFLFFIGLWRVVGTKMKKADEFIVVWFLSVVTMLAVGWKTVIQHSYYQIPLVPVCAFFVAFGYTIVRHSASGRRINTKRLWILAALLEVASLAYYYKGLYGIPNERLAILEAGNAVERLTPKDSLIVASHESSPIQLYYSHRRGWQFSITGRDDRQLMRELDSRRDGGANYFVVSNLRELRARPGFENALRRRYKVLEETSHYVIWDLRAAVALDF